MFKSVIQIVRRFGCVGGMESYVWFLSHELAKLGYQVTVICEESDAPYDPSIEIVSVTKSSARRRWKAMRDFNVQLDHLFKARPELLSLIIHSHERTAWHHVTTFHGPPMKAEKTLPWYKRLSSRIRYWLDVESRELCGPRVQRIVPVSQMIGSQLRDLYPEASYRMMGPAYPALTSSSPKPFKGCGQIFKLLFVGREWKRKGLSKAVEVCEALASRHPVQLDVFGVDSIDVPNSLAPPFVKFWGYQAEVPFEQYDLLVHPAVSEPFGMVVIEALSAGCRALVSDRVGASEYIHDGLVVMKSHSTSYQWANAAAELLGRNPDQSPKFGTWTDVAMYYDVKIYDGLEV